MHGSAKRPRVPKAGRGRPLKANAIRLLHQHLPQFTLPLPPPQGKLQLAQVFPKTITAYALELGFGSGEHLFGQSQKSPHVGFIGVEVFRGGIAKLIARLAENPLENLRIHFASAQDLLPLLPANRFQKIYCLFPDPWPKSRHHKRRLIHDSTIPQLVALLIPGGELRIVSDHSGFISDSLALLSANPQLSWLCDHPDHWRKPPADWIPTCYEAKAQNLNRPIAYLRFIRTTSPS